MIREAFALLDLISFFTAGRGQGGARARDPRAAPPPAAPRARCTPTSSAASCAAEVIAWEDLVDAGGYAAARERASCGVEGRDYEMRDGDVVTFRFTP